MCLLPGVPGLRPALLAGLTLVAACVPAEPAPASAAPAEPPPTDEMPAATPLVVAELFTSEGCSSCPPADRLLARLAQEAERGAEILALSYHVDYWDRLGWADPFGSPVYTARQRAYARTLDGRVYTPHLVVGGDAGFVGSRTRDVRAALAEAEGDAQPVAVTLTSELDDRTVRIAYTVERAPDAARLHLMLVQREGSSDVRRGENRGRQLRHANIVRAVDTRETGSGTAGLALPDGLDADDVFVAALVQPGRVGRILGAARADVSAGR